MTRSVRAVITEEPLDAPAIIAGARDELCGAVATFIGAVRNHDGGSSVTGIDYSAHPLAEETLRQIAESLIDRPGVHRIEAWHRVGRLDIGDDAMVVVVAAEHRAQAFGACEALVEEVKARLPIWKKQYRTDGSHEWSGLP